MVFLQVSDIHIGECRTLPGYLDRHKKVLEQVIEKAKEYRTSPIQLVVAGDLCEKNPTFAEQCLVAWFLGQIERNGIETILISGNHCHIGSGRTELDLFAELPYTHLHIFTKPGFHKAYAGHGSDIGFICLPWKGYTREQLKDLVETYLPNISECTYKVVVLHECIVGSKTDYGMTLPKGTSIPSIPEITYWAIGDIHGYQMSNVANGWYAGAPLQLTFGDKLPKGILEVDLHDPTRPKFIPLLSKPMVTVSSIEEITEDAHYKVKGDLETILKANRLDSVVKTDWDNRSAKSIEYKKMGITDGLPEFLAEEGLQEKWQIKALIWVERFLSLKVNEEV